MDIIEEAIGFVKTYENESIVELDEFIDAIQHIVTDYRHTKSFSDDVITNRIYSLLAEGGDLHELLQELIYLLEQLPEKSESTPIGFRSSNNPVNESYDLINESGIRNIKDLSTRFDKAEMYFHMDLDGVVTAIAMKSYLEKYGIIVIDAHKIQYGEMEFAIPKPSADGIMPVLVDFAHGKPMFTIHTDHHDSQAGVEDHTSTDFSSARSNVETISQTVSTVDLFPNEDILRISSIDSADYAKHGIDPEDVMNYVFKLSEKGSVPENKWMLALLTNKLLLAYKNKPGFLEKLVMQCTPSLLNIYQTIIKIANEEGYASSTDMKQNQEKYVDSQSKNPNLVLDGNIIIQYGGGALFKPGSYDRYTPFKLYPDADFLVTAWPMGLVQASCNPFKKERALKGINLADIAQEVLGKVEPQLREKMVPVSVIKRIGESKAKEDSVGFNTSDLYALYKDHLVNMPSSDNDYHSVVSGIIDTPWSELSEKQKLILDKVSVSMWDVVQANSGGHKCITNIASLNFFERAKRNPTQKYSSGDGYQARYVKFVKWVQKEIVSVLKERVNQ
tara:strand:- start:71 stop:1750 length:1680 start_codon:yes stop_codon:yes gene_type:complete